MKNTFTYEQSLRLKIGSRRRDDKEFAKRFIIVLTFHPSFRQHPNSKLHHPAKLTVKKNCTCAKLRQNVVTQRETLHTANCESHLETVSYNYTRSCNTYHLVRGAVYLILPLHLELFTTYSDRELPSSGCDYLRQKCQKMPELATRVGEQYHHRVCHAMSATKLYICLSIINPPSHLIVGRRGMQ